MHHMILRVHRNFFEITTFPNKHLVSGLGPALGFFTGVTTWLLFFLKFPFFPSWRRRRGKEEEEGKERGGAAPLPLSYSD